MIDMLPAFRSLPHDEEAERATLGSILMEPGLILPRVELSPDEFYLERHQLLMRAIQAVHEAGERPDLLTIKAHLERQGKLDQAGGIGYLATLDLDLPDYGRVEAYAAIVRETHLRRLAIQQAGEIIRSAVHDGEHFAASLARLQDELGMLSARSAPSKYRSAAELSDFLVEAIERRAESGEAGAVVTPWRRLNQILGHLAFGEIVLVVGPTGGGKTSFMMQLLADVVFRQRKNVGCVSLEMQASELFDRLLSLRTGIPFFAIRSYNRRMTDNHYKTIFHELREWKENDPGVEIDDSPWQSVADIAARARRLHRSRRGIDLLMIDYASLIAPSGKHKGNIHLELIETANTLKNVVKELNVPCVLLAQLNQDALNESLRGGEPHALGKTQGGGALPQAAYAHIFLYRDAEEGEFKETGRFIVAKHRGGPLGKVPVRFIGNTMSWEEI